MKNKRIDNITDEQIIDYLNYIMDNFHKRTLDGFLCKDVKNRIIYGDGIEEKILGNKVSNINKITSPFYYKAIDFLDREIENINIIKINKDDIADFVEYIKTIVENKEHIFCEAFKECIINKYLISSYFVFVREENDLYVVISIIEKILQYIYLLKVNKKDIEEKIAKKEQMPKIIKYVNLLLQYTNDTHTKYYLNNILNEFVPNTVSQPNLLQCCFYDITKILDKEYKKINKTKIENIASDIIFNIFLDIEKTKNRKIKENTQEIYYKGYKLTKYYSG